MKNNNSNQRYSMDEICPLCGRYDPDGSVCITCQKAFGVYKTNRLDGEEFCYVSQCGSGNAPNTGKDTTCV